MSVVAPTGSQGNQGPQGAQGQQGAQGPQGDTSNDVRTMAHSAFYRTGDTIQGDIFLMPDGGILDLSDNDGIPEAKAMALGEPYVLTGMHVALLRYVTVPPGQSTPVDVSVMRATGAAGAFNNILTLTLGTTVDDYDAPESTAVQLFANDRIVIRVRIPVDANLQMNGSITLRRGTLS